MRSLALLIGCGFALICGCAHQRYIEGRGDAGNFILHQALSYGGHAIATNDLPVIVGSWQYVQDEFGTGIVLSSEQYAAVETYLRSAFGPPSSQAGWAVRDVGVAIYLQKAGTNTQVGVLLPLSQARKARMTRMLNDTFDKNTP